MGIGSSRKAKIVVAPCPPKQLWKENTGQWVIIHYPPSTNFWGLEDVHFRELTQWIRDWQTCAEARGAALEEVNR